MNINCSNNQVNQCTGCGICAIVCPNKCISIIKNNNGFFEASVDEFNCSNCGLCTKFCYKFFNDTFENFTPLSVYACWSRDEELLKACSSGGFATILARSYIEKGYNICGVLYDYKNEICKHKIAKQYEDLFEFIGSKYLQSYTFEAFSKFKPNEKYIVFGSPCQILGLRKYIKFKKIENNFILVDFYCHGVPSYNLWEKYIEYLRICGISKINNINFVSKRNGWHNRCILINSNSSTEYFKNYKSDLFGIFYGGMYCHNSPCFRCIFRKDLVCSDIRVSDFWGSRFKSNQKGVNLITINTPAGEKAFSLIQNMLEIKNSSISDLKNSKPWRFYKHPIRYNKVINDLKSDKKLLSIYKKHIKPFLFFTRNLHRFVRIIKRFFNL